MRKHCEVHEKFHCRGMTNMNSRHFLHPYVLLCALCKKTFNWGCVKGNSAPHTNMDEIKRGNILHPDPSKKFACFYWTLMNLHMWLQTRRGFAWDLSQLSSCLMGSVATPTCVVECRKVSRNRRPVQLANSFPCKSRIRKNPS